VLRETVVELHHEVVEEAVAHRQREPFRLKATLENEISPAKSRRSPSGKGRRGRKR